MAKLSKERLEQIKNEIQMAEALNEEELKPQVLEGLERYTGIHLPTYGLDWDLVLNEVYPIIQHLLPTIFFRNPRAFLKPQNKTFISKQRNPKNGKMEEVQLDSGESARTQEALLNYIISKKIKFKEEVRKVLIDALLSPHGVLWHGYKGDFGMTEEQSIYIENEQIFAKRISPLRFIKDPAVVMADIDEAKWVGRIIDIPFIDLVEDKKLDVDKALIKGFKGFGEKIGRSVDERTGRDNLPRKSLIEFADKNFQDSKQAKFVRLYEVYLRPTKKEKRDGSKGKILLLTFEQEKPLRENDWKIKAKGWPAKILSFNELNDSVFGLSDIDTYKSIADQKNIITNLQIRNAQETSKVWIGIAKEGGSEEDIEAVRQGTNTIVRFDADDVRKRMFVASPGGSASNELYLIDQRIQRNLEDKSGVTDLKRGFLQSGEESATSVKIRNAGGGARPAYRQDLMSDFLISSLSYINHLNKQFMTVNDAVRIVGSLDLQWSENPSKEELQADVDVEIDVISMLPESPEKELRELNTVLTLLVQAMQSPEVMRKFATEGKTFNLSPLIEQMLLRMKMRDPEIFRNIKPEESEGFVSVKEIREAKENVNAAITGKQIPFPPTQQDDHVAKLEVYTAIQQLLTQAQQQSDILSQLIQVHQALLQEAQKKQANPGQAIKLQKPSLQTVGQ